jgi:phosphatidylglycerol:prolipoprotein diacylglycerol transferase
MVVNPPPVLDLAYAGMVLLGAALLLAFQPAKVYEPVQRRQYWRLQLITLFGALIGAKFAALVGDTLWPMRPFTGWTNMLLSGRSIVGALLFGFVTAEVAKPLLGDRQPPNDRFAVLLPFSLATGRLGCWMAGCCLGVEMHGPLGVVGKDGVERFPAALVEMGFHLLAGVTLIWLLRRGRWPGRLFALYLIAYGIFRFATEFLRVTPKAWEGWSAYQWFALMLVAAGLVSLYLRRELPTRALEAAAP